MNDITRYVLSDIAEFDIGDIYDYTLANHGAAQAATYLTGLDTAFEQLIDNPMSGKERPEIRAELRSIIYNHHTVFYRIMDTHIRIVRVLHSSRDMPRHF